MTGRPEYDRFTNMSEERGPLARQFALQVLATARPWLPGSVSGLRVLDAGCGYGHTAVELASMCHSVVGLEPSAELHAAALVTGSGVANLSFIRGDIASFEAPGRFDLVVLDNVFEHLSEPLQALGSLRETLRPGGVLYLLTPNKLWPIEAHYRLPGLAWLPLGVADRYLRASGRGSSYEDASYAPTYWQLNRHLAAAGFSFEFVLPAVGSATVAGSPPHYRLGMGLIRRVPSLWAISKALLVIAQRAPD